MGDTPLNEEVNMTIGIAGQQYVFMGEGYETTTLARTANYETGDNY